jgi:hypothetical protein
MLSPKEQDTKREFGYFLANLKKLLGEYLAKRKESKFEIIENVMKMMVFENKAGEIKFLEDALGHTKVSSSLSVIQDTMRVRGMLLSQGIDTGTATGTDTGNTPKGDEEVLKFSEECSCKNIFVYNIVQIDDSTFSSGKKFCISNYGVYIITDLGKDPKSKKESVTCDYSWEYGQIEFFGINEVSKVGKLLFIGKTLKSNNFRCSPNERFLH